jgi:hypothetical protein
LPVGVGTIPVEFDGYVVVTGGMRVRLPVGSGTLRVEFTITVTVAENPWAVKLVPVGKKPVEFAEAGGTTNEAVTGAVVLTNGVGCERTDETVTTTVDCGATSVVALELGTGRNPDPDATLDREKPPVRLSPVELRISVVVFNTTGAVVVELRDTGGGVTEGAMVVVALKVGIGTDAEAVGDREKPPLRSSPVELRISVVVFNAINTVVVELRDTGGGVTEGAMVVVTLELGTGRNPDPDATLDREKPPVRLSPVELRISVVVFNTTGTVAVELNDTGGGVTEAGAPVVALNVGAGTDTEAVGGREKPPVRLSPVELRFSLETALVLVVFNTVSTVSVVVELRETGGGVAEGETSVVALRVGADTDTEAVGGLEKSPLRSSPVELRVSVELTLVIFSVERTVTVKVEFKEAGGRVAEGETSVVALRVGAGTDTEAVGGLEKSPLRSSPVELRISVEAVLVLVLVVFSVERTVTVMVEFKEAGGRVAEGETSVVALRVGAGTDTEAVGGLEKSPLRSSPVELSTSVEAVLVLVLVAFSVVNTVSVVVEFNDAGGRVAEGATSVVSIGENTPESPVDTSTTLPPSTVKFAAAARVETATSGRLSVSVTMTVVGTEMTPAPPVELIVETAPLSVRFCTPEMVETTTSVGDGETTPLPPVLNAVEVAFSIVTAALPSTTTTGDGDTTPLPPVLNAVEVAFSIVTAALPSTTTTGDGDTTPLPPVLKAVEVEFSIVTAALPSTTTWVGSAVEFTASGVEDSEVSIVASVTRVGVMTPLAPVELDTVVPIDKVKTAPPDVTETVEVRVGWLGRP